MLDRDLVELDAVTTGRLKEAVRRMPFRFPGDVAFQLTWEETALLSRSQSAILKRGRNPKYRPFAFTEQGIAMLSSVLRSDEAILVNVAIMRTFVRLRQLIAADVDIACRLEDVERRVKHHEPKLTAIYQVVGDLISTMVEEEKKSRKRIGFELRKKRRK